ncbi:MAG: DNA-binding protein WhiA [Lachnospiraceae bacterium]|nr:DNA-binding protein WhiA [Lachnospiraceae bacterium]
MSFSSDVKEEIAKHYPTARHCQLAELSAIISMCGSVSIDIYDRYKIKIVTENVVLARKCFTLLRKAFNISTEVVVKHNISTRRTTYYSLVIKNNEDALRVLKAIKIIDMNYNMVVQQACCKRAFIRGAFLVAGSISDPSKSYHLEVVCSNEDNAKKLQNIINFFEIDSKVVQRKNHYIVYIKEGTQIVEFLNVMEAHVALMELENVRIIKEMRNSLNRQVNCETANMGKTISAAVKQIEDIKYISATVGLDSLSENLEEVARVRMQYPQASLKEIGTYLSPSVGKSGVNHRLKKISEYADQLRSGREEKE